MDDSDRLLDDELRRLQQDTLRVCWPRLLFPQDVSTILRIKTRSAAKAMSRGQYGRVVRIGRRLAVFREDFVAALRRDSSNGARAAVTRGGRADASTSRCATAPSQGEGT